MHYLRFKNLIILVRINMDIDVGHLRINNSDVCERNKNLIAHYFFGFITLRLLSNYPANNFNKL